MACSAQTVAMRKASWTTSRDLADYRHLFNCLVCVDATPPVRPRLLACRHAFCDQCLHGYRALLGGGGGEVGCEGAGGRMSLGAGGVALGGETIMCPVCRKMTSLSLDGSIGLDLQLANEAADSGIGGGRKVSLAADAIQRCDACVHRRRIEPADFYCAKCALNYCSHCRSAHDQQPLFRDHVVIHVSSKDAFKLCCETHGRADCVYYCLDCSMPCCTICLLHDEHHNHAAARLREALATRRDALKTLLNEFAPRLDWIEAKAKLLSRFSAHEKGYKNKTKSGSCSSVGDMPLNATYSNGRRPSDVANGHHDPNLSHSRLGAEIPGVIAPPLRSISNDNLAVTPPSLTSAETHDVIKTVTSYVERFRKLFVLSTNLLELSQSKKLLSVYTDVVARIHCVLDWEIHQLQNKIDELYACEAAAAAPICRPLTNQMSQPAVTWSDVESSGCSVGSSEGGRTRHGSGVSQASTTPLGGAVDPLGLDRLPLTSMLVRPKLLWKVEKQRADQDELWNPCGAAFLPNNRGLIVAEYDVTHDRNNKLRVFDAKGRSVSVLARGQIQPLGVAITRGGQVAATDCKGKRVKVFTLGGQLVLDIGKGQFGWPYGIAATSRGQLVVTDAFSDCVSIYSMEGKRIRQFGGSGSGNSQFRNPYHVAMDAQDNIYISDSGNNAIKVFDISGRYIFTASEMGIRRSASDNLSLTKQFTPTQLPSPASQASITSSDSSSSHLPFVSENAPRVECSVDNKQRKSSSWKLGGVTGIMSGASSLVGSLSSIVGGVNSNPSLGVRSPSAAGSKLRRRRLKNPRGVAVDLKGNILVADDCSRVSMFDGAGRYVRHLLTDEDMVRYPEVVHCSDDLLVVTEWNPNNMFAVKVFTLYERTCH